MSGTDIDQGSARQRLFLYCWGFSLFVSLIITPLFMCACGHLSAAALPVTIFAAVLAWVPFLCSGRQRLSRRIILLAVMIISTLWLVKNAADVLWLGHHPVFEHMKANERGGVDAGRALCFYMLRCWSGATHRDRWATRTSP